MAKLVLFPLVAYGLGMLFGLSGIALSIAVIFGAMPTAVSAYILIELGGDVSIDGILSRFKRLRVCGTSLLVPFALKAKSFFVAFNLFCLTYHDKDVSFI